MEEQKKPATETNQVQAKTEEAKPIAPSSVEAHKPEVASVAPKPSGVYSATPNQAAPAAHRPQMPSQPRPVEAAKPAEAPKTVEAPKPAEVPKPEEKAAAESAKAEEQK